MTRAADDHPVFFSTGSISLFGVTSFTDFIDSMFFAEFSNFRGCGRLFWCHLAKQVKGDHKTEMNIPSYRVEDDGKQIGTRLIHCGSAVFFEWNPRRLFPL